MIQSDLDRIHPIQPCMCISNASRWSRMSWAPWARAVHCTCVHTGIRRPHPRHRQRYSPYFMEHMYMHHYIARHITHTVSGSLPPRKCERIPNPSKAPSPSWIACLEAGRRCILSRAHRGQGSRSSKRPPSPSSRVQISFLWNASVIRFRSSACASLPGTRARAVAAQGRTRAGVFPARRVLERGRSAPWGRPVGIPATRRPRMLAAQAGKAFPNPLRKGASPGALPAGRPGRPRCRRPPPADRLPHSAAC